MYYPWDPRLKTSAELKATEFISQKVIDQIMKSIIPDKKGKLTNQSWLVYGARGMGKSHILTLIYHKTKEDKKFSEKWIPILCPEELYTVNNLYRLFKEFAFLIIAESAKEREPKEIEKYKVEINEIADVRIKGTALERKESERQLTDRFLEVILKINRDTKKKFLFLIENLQELFCKQISEDEQKYLRDVFFQYTGLMIWIASAVQIPGKLADYGMPFYHFFRTRKLEGMNSDEIMKMLYNLCDLNNKDNLRKNLQEMKSDISVFGLLSGGNPRLIMLLYKFLENGKVKGIKDMMKIFITDLTPYFQKETETLTYQQRLIIDSLSTNVFPLISKKDIAEDCNLPEDIVGSQVNKLKNSHWLRMEKIKPRKNELFILNEYIYRVWYQMRMGGIYQENARWISEFLSFIYPVKKIQTKIGELENLISKGEFEDKVFIRSELETYRKALVWQQQEEVKRYFEILREKNEIISKEIEDIGKLIENKEFKKSLSLLEKSKEKIKEYMYYGIKGFIYGVLRKNVEAIELYSKAIELNPEYAAAYDNRGNIYADLKQDKKAIEDYTKAIELNSEYADAYYNRGNSYFNLKQDEKAVEDFSKVIELNPEYADAYNNRGNIYADLKQDKKAVEDFTKVIELNPEYAAAYNNRGISYANLKQDKKAIEDYTRAIELNPEDADAYYNRGNNYSDLKQYEKAIEDYTKAIELNPEDAITYNIRGNSYFNLKQYEKAIKDYTKVIELKPGFACAYNNRGNKYSNLKQYEKAIKDYTKAIKLNPEYTAAYYNRGNRYSNLKQYEKAIEDYTRAIKLNPEYVSAYNNRGTIYSVLKQYEKAIEDYTKANELNSEYASAYYNRGNSFLKLNEFENGVKDFLLYILKNDNLLNMIKRMQNTLYYFINDNYKVSDSLQNLFGKGVSKKEKLKHILILTYYKQNEILRTYLSENDWSIFKEKESPYPVMISFTALFNLIGSIKSSNPKYMEFVEIWVKISKNIEFEDKKQEENIFNKSLMLIYSFAIRDKESSEIAVKVLKQINKEYHSIAESHFYIPIALIDEKNTDVQRLMKDPIFKETVEKIKIQREM